MGPAEIHPLEMTQVFFIVKGPFGRFGGMETIGVKASGHTPSVDLCFWLFSPGD